MVATWNPAQGLDVEQMKPFTALKGQMMSAPKNTRTTAQQDFAKEARKLKTENASDDAPYPTDKTPDLGMRRIEHVDQAPSGALDDVGDKPARERSRERR